jgi:glucose-fructose oxidoreductase
LPTSIVLNRGDERHVFEAPGVDQYASEADHFVQSVRAGRLLAPAEDGLAQARVIEALYRSAETGQSVRLP